MYSKKKKFWEVYTTDIEIYYKVMVVGTHGCLSRLSAQLRPAQVTHNLMVRGF